MEGSVLPFIGYEFVLGFLECQIVVGFESRQQNYDEVVTSLHSQVSLALLHLLTCLESMKFLVCEWEIHV